MDHRVRMAIDFMTANLKDPPPLCRLARQVNLSVSHLRHLFRQETGQSTGDYLMTLRMQKASELLAGRTLSVKEIMNQVGFKDRSNFVRTFKRAYGTTPSAYRDRAMHGIKYGPGE